MTTVQKITVAVVAVILLVILLTVVSMALPQSQSTSEITFSCVGVSTSSNASSASIVINNPTSSRIVYSVGDPELKLNGVWENYQFPIGKPMRLLGPGLSVTNVVTRSPGSGEVRVPILWGFVYSPKANKLQALWENVQASIRMHNSRGRGALYTNFVTDIKM